MVGTLVGVVHGTESGYKRGCRCDACTAANSDAQRRRGTRPCKVCGRRVWARPSRDLSSFLEHGERCRSCWLRETGRLVHGTESGYKRGCRCDCCRKAANKARAERRRCPSVARHGWNGYKNGCRCDVCREGHATYMWLRLA